MDKKSFLKPLFPLSLRFKIILYFGLMFAMVLAAVQIVEQYGVPFSDFDGEYKERTLEVFRKLDLVADMKKEHLQRWIEERNDDVEVLAHSSLVKDSIKSIQKAIRVDAAQGKDILQIIRNEELQNLSKHLELVKYAYGVYDEIEIVDRDTHLTLASTYSPDIGRKVPEEDVFANIISPDDMYMNVRENPHRTGNKFTLLIAHCVSIPNSIGSNEEQTVAIIMAYINPSDFIKPLLHTGGGLGETGEALLVDQNRKILVPLKHALPNGTTAEPLEYQITAKPATFAARGEEGVVASSDYRRVPVLAAFRHICFTPEVRWGMVVKRDIAEVFALVHRSRAYTFVVALIGSFVALLFIGLIASKITYPINIMTKVAKRVQSNDFTTKAEVVSADELGFLAGAFNSMIDRIQNWKEELETKVRDRTAELEASEAKYQDLYTNAPDMFVSVDAATARIIQCNQTLAAATGYSKDEIVGKSIFEMYHHDSREDAKRAFELFTTIGEVRDTELQLIRKDGSKIEVTLNASAVRDEQGKILHSRSVWRDITERKRAQENLQKAYARLEEQSALLAQSEKTGAIGTLVAGTAHELNNPLTAILNFSAHCRKHTSRDDELYPVLEDIEYEAKRCADIVKNLLTFSHAEQDDDKAYQKENLTEIFGRVLRLLSYRIEKQRVSVTQHIAENTPQVFINPNSIQQLVLNLTTNALDALEDSEKKELNVDVGREGEYVRMTIADTGCGIHEDSLNSIFDPFFTTKPVGHGTGLGLSVSQGIVKTHGGQITCESKPGAGTKFIILLPIEGSRQNEEANTCNRRRFSGKKIVCINT